MRQPTEEQRKNAEARRERFKEIVKKVAAMTEDEKTRLANTIPRLVNPEGHCFTLHNTLLIVSQGAENPTILGGFKQWIKQGRAVKKGEHGYMILFPKEKKNDQDQTLTEEDKKDPEIRFLIGYVFDISQTIEIQTQGR